MKMDFRCFRELTVKGGIQDSFWGGKGECSEGQPRFSRLFKSALLHTPQNPSFRKIRKIIENIKIKKLAPLSFQNPWHHNSDKNNSNSNKKLHKIQLISNTPISKSNKVNKKIFSQHFIKALLSHSFGKFRRFFFCAATFSEFWRKIWWVLIDFFGWMKCRLFSREFWRIFGVLEPMEFWWIICGIFLGSWTGLGGFVFWKRRFIPTRNKKSIFQSLWATRNQKHEKLNLSRVGRKTEPKLVNHKIQRTWKKLSKSPNLDRKIREICWGARTIQNSLVSPNLDSWSCSDFPSPLYFQVPTNTLCSPGSGPANKITSKSWGRAKRWLRSWKWVGRRDVIHLWKPNPQKNSQITHPWNSRRPFYSFFRWIIKSRVIRDFQDFFEAINLELLLSGFQNIFWWFFDERLWARPGCCLG